MDTHKMALAGAKLSQVMQRLANAIQPGVTTLELDEMAEVLIREQGCMPAFKGYQGFPSSICACHSDEVVHGVPDDRHLEEGCLLTLDVGVNFMGWHADSAFTVVVGGRKHASIDEINLMEATRAALAAGVRAAQPGNRTGDVGAAIGDVAMMYGVHVVPQFTGHGIGHLLHMPPLVPNHGIAGTGDVLEPWTAIAIEPIFLQRAGGWSLLEDGWTTKTEQSISCAHFEHTVLITPDGPWVMTQLPTLENQ